MQLPHLISAKNFTRAQLDALFEKSATIKKWLNDTSCWTEDGKYLVTRPRSGALMGQTMALIFDQPSLRTSSSFETAMYSLGGNCITYRNASRESSIAKDESLEDTVEMLSGNPTVSVLVLRHPEPHAAERAAAVSSVPIINAGDGTEHPTQALVDLFTIQEALDSVVLDSVDLSREFPMHVTIIGDPRARTARSLIYSLVAAYHDNVFISFIYPKGLGLGFEEEDTGWAESPYYENFYGMPVPDVIGSSHALYVIRPQQENWYKNIENPKARGKKIAKSLEQYYRICTVDNQVLAKLPKNSIVLHPRPRGPELPTEVDSDSRVLHARQGRNGGPVRIALLEMMHSGEWQKLAKQ